MPIKKCTTDSGKSGFQYGNQKCYAQRDKAIKQMRAIKASQSRQKK